MAGQRRVKKTHDENEPVAPVKQVNITLRPATPRDATPLYDLLIRYFDELGEFYPGPVEGPTMAWGMSIVVKGGCVVALEDGKIIGSIGMEIGQYPWNPSTNYLNGVWFYVAPERRAGGTADRLMGAAKDIARRNKMGLRLDNVWGVEPKLQDLYRQRHGFRYVGGNHVWFPSEAGA